MAEGRYTDILLLGKTGMGKSTTGNKLLGLNGNGTGDQSVLKVWLLPTGAGETEVRKSSPFLGGKQLAASPKELTSNSPGSHEDPSAGGNASTPHVGPTQNSPKGNEIKRPDTDDLDNKAAPNSTREQDVAPSTVAEQTKESVQVRGPDAFRLAQPVGTGEGSSPESLTVSPCKEDDTDARTGFEDKLSAPVNRDTLGSEKNRLTPPAGNVNNSSERPLVGANVDPVHAGSGKQDCSQAAQSVTRSAEISHEGDHVIETEVDQLQGSDDADSFHFANSSFNAAADSQNKGAEQHLEMTDVDSGHVTHGNSEEGARCKLHAQSDSARPKEMSNDETSVQLRDERFEQSKKTDEERIIKSSDKLTDSSCRGDNTEVKTVIKGDKLSGSGNTEDFGSENCALSFTAGNVKQQHTSVEPTHTGNDMGHNRGTQSVTMHPEVNTDGRGRMQLCNTGVTHSAVEGTAEESHHGNSVEKELASPHKEDPNATRWAEGNKQQGSDNREVSNSGHNCFTPPTGFQKKGSLEQHPDGATVAPGHELYGEEACKYFRAGQGAESVTVCPKVISNEATRVRVCDTPGFAQSGSTIPVIPGNLELIRQVLFCQQDLNLKFSIVLYFVPFRGNPERSDGVLKDEITILQHYFGKSIWERLVVVITAPQRYQTQRYFSECGDPMAATMQVVHKALRSVAQRYKKPEDCTYLRSESSYRFLSCHDESESVLMALLSSLKSEGGLSLSQGICVKCSQKVTFKVTIPENDWTGKEGHIPTVPVKSTSSFCHPRFKSSWRSFPRFGERCVNCQQKPGTQGCLPTGVRYEENLTIEHKSSIEQLQL